jgi:CDP-2,3-bis-(O-geranylgeranyl)-sn-glycerol synthase
LIWVKRPACRHIRLIKIKADIDRALYSPLMLQDLLHAAVEAAWFLLPAGAANVAPVVAAAALPRYDWPVDFGATARGRRLFGSHKTWRGLTTGVLAAMMVFALQQTLFEVEVVREISYFDYTSHSWLLGAWMGSAALLGDLVKSAVKRQINVAPGRAWLPFDQIDWLLGTILLVSPVIPMSVVFATTVLATGLTLHLLMHFLGYLLRLNPSGI